MGERTSGAEGVVRLAPLAEKAMRALAAAAIDPGELTLPELIVRLRPTPPEVVGRVMAGLTECGLVVHEPGAIESYHWTEAGRALCVERRFPAAWRT